MNEFQAGYIEAALFSSTDESDDTGGIPLDENYGPDDIAPDTLAKMMEDCNAFIENASPELAECNEHFPDKLDDRTAGFNFWITRNNHGAGFWDLGLGELGDALTAKADGFGEFNLYIGDDNLIHGS